jgi:putative transposase
MSSRLKTLSVRVRDKHAKVLREMAFGVNQVWNAVNELSAEYSWVPIPEVGYMNLGTSAYDLMTELKHIRKDKRLAISAATTQVVIATHYKSRRQFKKNKLRWRVSSGPRRSLGWVPFRVGTTTWRNGQVKFNGHFFKVWDSYGLSQYEFRSGSFNEDARGRWYFNVVVEVEQDAPALNNAVGIDLGLKDTATCSNGEKLEAGRFYRDAQLKLAKAQRANNRKQVRSIHAKIKNRRKDALHKFSAKIAKENSFIVIGNVSGKALAKTNMAKSVFDAGWYMLKTQIRYKSIRHGSEFIEVDERYSTRLCSCCGSIPDSSPKGRTGLVVRNWECSDCGATHDRDVNAAKNILNFGFGCKAPVDGISVH